MIWGGGGVQQEERRVTWLTWSSNAAAVTAHIYMMASCASTPCIHTQCQTTTTLAATAPTATLTASDLHVTNNACVTGTGRGM